jgi:hypothetical protein
MAIVTLGEILDKANAYESRLEAFYASVRDRSTDNGVRLLTYYLARHCRHQAMALAQLAPRELRHLRKIEIRRDLPARLDHPEKLLQATPETVTGDQLIETALRQSSELVELYLEALEQPMIDEAHDVVEALLHIEESDIVMLTKMKAVHYF